MQDSGAPTKIPLPFGSAAGSGFINPIPTPSQIGITNGRASFTDGFPPLNFQPISAGGVPPFGGDFNGLLFQLSGGLQWLQAGGPIFYDATFQAAIGGYPKGAVIASVAYAGLWWYSQVDNNTTNPDAAGANWLAISSGISHAPAYYAVAGTYTYTILSPNTRVQVWGAGGGGGGTFGAACGASGGAGGGYSEGVVTGLTPGGTITVNVGAGGTSGTAGSTPTNGGAGGTSSFASTSAIQATGGGGGTAETGGYQQTIPTGGAGSGGSINISGDFGWAAFAIGSSSYTAPGGAAWGCGSTHPTVTPSAAVGNNGAFPGQGGCGGVNGGAGGVGAGGLVIITPL